MTTYIIVDANNAIVNSVLWDGDISQWQPPQGTKAIKYAGVWQSGWVWNGSEAINPNPPPDPLPAAPAPPAATPSPGIRTI